MQLFAEKEIEFHLFFSPDANLSEDLDKTHLTVEYYQKRNWLTNDDISGKDPSKYSSGISSGLRVL